MVSVLFDDELKSRLRKRTRSTATRKRLHIFWSGRVQGVGFRYTAEAAALELKLTGWVRNTPDGRVEAVAEGPEVALRDFIQRIAEGPMKPHIKETQADWEEPRDEFGDFRIRFY